MPTATITAPGQREPQPLGQTVVAIGGGSGVGLETARRARTEGAEVILAGRNRERLMQTIEVTRTPAAKSDPGGTPVFMSAIEGRRPGAALTIVSAVTAAMSALIASLALEFALLRVNQIAAGFIDSPLSASLLGDTLENRRNQLRSTLPIGRAVEPADVAVAGRPHHDQHGPHRRDV
jgi:NAD(P)-dependent dehydrogenase (short-subunit alcohol dehydrogenase family)